MKKFLFLMLVLSYSLLAKETPILAIHSYHELYPWTQSQRSGFREILSNDPKLSPIFSVEYLDTKRRDFDSEYETEFVHYMKNKYKGYKPELIYVTDDNALNFILRNQNKLFPKVPVVFSGINDLSKKETLPQNSFTGIYEKKEIVPNLKLIKTLFPKEQEVLLIGDGSLTAQAIQQDIKHDTVGERGVKIRFINDQNFELILRELEVFKGKAIVLTTIGGFRTQEGTLLPLKDAINRIVKAGNFVTLSLEDSYIQYGVLGGYADDGFTQGASAGGLALQILSHPQSPLPRVIQNTNGWIFDAKVLEERSIVLPDEIASQSKILNPPEPFFQKHQELLIVLLYGLSVTVIMGSLSYGWLMYRSRKIILKKGESLSRLSESLNKAQSIAHLGNWEWDIQANVLWWSDEIYRIFGLEPQQFQATYDEFLERVFPEDRDLIQTAVMNTLHNDTAYCVAHRIIKQDGTIRYVSEEGDLVRDHLGNPLKMIGIVHDITEEHEREEKLILQAQIIDTVQDSIIVHDDEGKFIYLNDNAWKSRGYTREEMMRMSVKELDASEYTNGNPEEMKILMEQMRQQGWLRVEVEHMCKNGDKLPVEVYAKQITLHDKSYVLSSIRDISERKTAQIALEESEKKYKDLVEHSMVGVYRSDLLGNILYVNPALAQMLSFDSPDELIGKNSMMRYKNPEDRSLFIQQLSQEHHLNNYELEILDKHGIAVSVMVSATVDEDILSGMIIDMREIKQSRYMVDKLSKAIEQVDDILYITDQFGNISYVNEAYCRHTGYTREEVIGKNSRISKSGVHDKELWTTILSGETYRNTIINRKKNGDLYYEKKTISPLKDDNQKIVGFISAGKDVTEETLLHQEIEKIATIDKLTGLCNRHKFEELFSMEEERSRRFLLPLSMIMIDIDHFKAVNDTYGHDIGDEVLKHLTITVQENIRKIDIFARWGGEEFLVLCPGTDLKHTQKLAEKLRIAVDHASFPKIGHVTISLGVSTFNKSDTFSELFKRADQGLYYAKEHGRNQVGVNA